MRDRASARIKYRVPHAPCLASLIRIASASSHPAVREVAARRTQLMVAGQSARDDAETGTPAALAEASTVADPSAAQDAVKRGGGDASQHRDLAALPKTHLHLHFSQACIRRSTLKSWLRDLETNEERLGKMQAEAKAQIAAALEQAGGDESASAVVKYRRRLQHVTPPLRVQSVFGEEYEGEEGVARMDCEVPQPGDKPIWDMQWMAKQLIETHPEGVPAAERQILFELGEDAVAEGIRWVELAAGCTASRKEVVGEDGEPRTVACYSEGEAAAWKHRLRTAKDVAERFGVGIAFVVVIPKAKKDETPEMLVEFLQRIHSELGLTLGGSEDTLHGGVVGVGQWGGEVNAVEEGYEPVYEVLRRHGLPAIVLHAGEHRGQASSAAAAYDGVANIRAALKCGARRIGHGVEAARSVELCEALKRAAQQPSLSGHQSACCLEVCPISNLRLRYCDAEMPTEIGHVGSADVSEDHAKGALRRHPLKALVNFGVPCALAADDPTFFGARSAHGLLREYEAARWRIGMSDGELAQCAKWSIRHSRAPRRFVEQWLGEVDEWLAQ